MLPLGVPDQANFTTNHHLCVDAPRFVVISPSLWLSIFLVVVKFPTRFQHLVVLIRVCLVHGTSAGLMDLESYSSVLVFGLGNDVLRWDPHSPLAISMLINNPKDP